MRMVIAVSCAGLLFSGCASITNEKMQPISVTTVMDNVPVAGIGCSLMNDEGSWYVTTPGSVVVHKSTAALAIDCRKANVGAGSQTFESSANGSVWGNIIFGGLVGYVVDRNSGAGFDYPSNLTVAIRPFGLPVSPSAATVEQPAPPPATPTPVHIPRPTAAPKPTRPAGEFGYEAAKFARERRCAAADTPAQFVAKGPGFESYSVACTSGDVMMVRCEFGTCRALH